MRTSGLSPETLSTLLAVSTALVSSLELNTVLQTAIEHTCAALELDTGAIYLLDGNTLYLGATTPPLPEDFPLQLRYARLADHPHCERSLAESRVIYLEDFRDSAVTPQEQAVCESRNLHSLLFIPLLLENEAVGVMIVGSTGDRVKEFTETDVDLCWVLAYQVTLAVANARLYSSLQEANSKVIETNLHLERLVQERTENLAQANEELQAQAEELLSLAEELQNSNDARARFFRSMSHELRTPLNSIIGFSAMMQSGLAGDVTDEQRLQLSMVNNAGKHLLAVVSDLLDLSRIDAGALNLAYAPIDVAQLVHECVDTVSATRNDAEVTISAHIPTPCPPLVSDVVRVRQVLLNLLDNAAKFTERGTVEVEVAQPAKHLLAFTVRDTGPGISAEKLGVVFGEFERALENRDRTVEGTGLGLAVSRGLAAALGGTITAQSTPGEGSAFTFAIPLTPDPTVADSATA